MKIPKNLKSEKLPKDVLLSTRIPSALREELERIADREGRSLSAIARIGCGCFVQFYADTMELPTDD